MRDSDVRFQATSVPWAVSLRRGTPEGETNVLGFRRHAKAPDGTCTHAKALPRWDKVEDAGNLERVSSFYCPTCDQFLAPNSLREAGVPPAPAP
jgi:hypothetical protein